jgi:hypothetical protein
MPSVQSKGLEPSLKTRAASNRIFANEDVTYKFVDLTQGDVATLRRSFTRISTYSKKFNTFQREFANANAQLR